MDVQQEVLQLNQQGMEYLNYQDYENAGKALKQAKALLDRSKKSSDAFRIESITLNNLGCFYTKSQKPKIALMYLRRALMIEIKSQQDVENIAGTHLNIWAIFSQTKDHDKALFHAKQAMNMLTDMIIDLSALSSKTTLGIAYHNVATEYEHLKRFPMAVKYFEKGYNHCLNDLGQGHNLTIALWNNLQSAKTKVAGKQLGPLRFNKRHGSLSPRPPKRIQFKSRRLRTPVPNMNRSVQLKFSAKDASILRMGVAGTRQLKTPTERLRIYS